MFSNNPKTITEIVEALQALGFRAYVTPCGDASVAWVSAFWASPYVNDNGTEFPPYTERTWDGVVQDLSVFNRNYGCRQPHR